MLEANDSHAPEDRMQFRMGVHCGEVVVDGDRIYGSGIKGSLKTGDLLFYGTSSAAIFIENLEGHVG